MSTDTGVESAVEEPTPAADASAQPQAPGPAGASVTPRAPRRRLADVVGRVADRLDAASFVQLLAVVPVASVTLLVLQATKLQWWDYWTIFPRIVNPDGSLAEGQLLHYHEGHIIAIPTVVYWLNYKLTSGVNTPLGLFVVGLVLAQVWMLRRLFPRAAAVGRWVYALVFVAVVALLFAPQGAHNFARSMSGTAWLLANFFAVAALLVASRGSMARSLPVAVLLGVLASLSYGTGLMVWPALVVLSAVRGRWSRWHTALSAIGVAAMGAYFFFYDRPASQSSVGFDPNDMARRAAQVLGSVLTSNAEGAVAIGVLAVVVAAFAAVRAVQVDRVGAAPWVALVVYAVLGAAMIGAARGGINGDDIGTSSRYYSLSALCWAAVLVLLAVARPRDPRVVGAALLVGGLAFVGGQPAVGYVREVNHSQDELAIAMRLELSESYPFLYGYNRHVPLLKDLGHYPFSGAYDADCGRTGRTIESDATVTDLDAARSHLDGFVAPYNDASVRLQGWVVIPGHSVDCVLVVDEDMTVIGAGAYGIPRVDLVAAGGSPTGNYDVGFVAVAPADEPSYRVLVETNDDLLVMLPGEADPNDRASYVPDA